VSRAPNAEGVPTISSGVQPLAPGSQQISARRRNVARKLTLSRAAPRYLRPEHVVQARETTIDYAIGLGWSGRGEGVAGRLEPAGAQVRAESRQAERGGQAETAKPHDCFIGDCYASLIKTVTIRAIIGA
jgi:hypothetical protein